MKQDDTISKTLSRRNFLKTAGGAAAFAGLATAGLPLTSGIAQAAGLVGGILRASQPDPLYINFVNRCLNEKGYEIVGWQ